MELQIHLYDGTVDRYYADEQHYTEETGELTITPSDGRDFAICTYAEGKWIKARRVLESGESWPVPAVRDIGDIEKQASESSIGHMVEGIGNGPGDVG